MQSRQTSIICAGLLLAASYAQAQTTTCDQIKAENTRLRAEIAALKGQAGATPAMVMRVQSDNGIEFKIISVVGDRRSQTVTVSTLVTNQAANKKYFTTEIEGFSDANGEQYKLGKFLIGGDTYGKDLYTGAPLKTTHVFEGVMPSTTAIKLLPYAYSFNTGSNSGSVEFRDLPISWK